MNNEEKILEMLAAMQSEMGAMRSDMADLKATQAKQGEQLSKQGEQLSKQGEQLDRLEEKVGELDARSLKSAVLLETEVARDVHLIYEGHSEINRKLGTLATKDQVEELSSDVDVIKDVVTRHSSDISKLKKAQ